MKIMTNVNDTGPAPLVTNIERVTLENTNYRSTLWTGKNLQVTLMSIEPDHDVGLEVHEDNDQFLRIEAGEATIYMGETKENMTTWQSGADEVIIVPAGTWHNLVNTGDVPLKIYSIYAPPHHPHGTVHVTKEEASEAEADE